MRVSLLDSIIASTPANRETNVVQQLLMNLDKGDNDTILRSCSLLYTMTLRAYVS